MSHIIHHAFPLTHPKREKSTSTENSHSNSSKRFVTYLHTRETNFTTRENIYFYVFLFIFIFLVFLPSDIRFIVLLWNYHYRIELDFWCYH